VISGSSAEVRGFVRFPLQLPLAVRLAHEEYRGHTANISSGGVLFEVEKEMAPGAVIEFTISLPAHMAGASRDVHMNCVGRVVRSYVRGETRAVAALIDHYSLER
jgi:hypothetical protein